MEISIGYILGMAAVLAGNMLIAWEVGRFFTEERRPLFNFKPFNCRPCFTFWATFAVTWVSFGVFAFPWWVDAVNALIIAFINFTIVKTKFKVYE